MEIDILKDLNESALQDLIMLSDLFGKISESVEYEKYLSSQETPLTTIERQFSKIDLLVSRGKHVLADIDKKIFISNKFKRS